MRFSLIVLLAAYAFGCLSQTAPDKYWIQFSDKNNTPFSVDSPGDFLSEKALERRAHHGVEVEERDLPITPEYITEILAFDSVSLVNVSKWFNAITIETPDSLLIEELADLPFVSQTRSVGTFPVDLSEPQLFRSPFPSADTTFYGPSYHQISMLGGHLLHEAGFRGATMDIAILDAGYINLFKLPAFDELIESERILGTHDFVDGDNSVHYNHAHGMYVLSTMAGIIPDSLVGTAPEANYRLYRTEDVSYENVVEEDNWIAAIEHADSAGIWLVNTSLGYSLFDDSLAHHTYASLDGNTTRITQASDWAAQRGMLLVNSAGNSGSAPWHFITPPADADSILTVGSVDPNGFHVSFSSFGPTADGRVKPDVMALGYQCVIADHDSTIRLGNGTSFSAPITCGLAACLWQANSDRTNMEIIDAIRESASLYTMPNDSMGYGIPNFWRAHLILQSVEYQDNPFDLNVWPIPFSDQITMSFVTKNESQPTVRLLDSIGRDILIQIDPLKHDQYRVRTLNRSIADLPRGMYFLQVYDDDRSSQKTLVKY